MGKTPEEKAAKAAKKAAKAAKKAAAEAAAAAPSELTEAEKKAAKKAAKKEKKRKAEEDPEAETPKKAKKEKKEKKAKKDKKEKEVVEEPAAEEAPAAVEAPAAAAAAAAPVDLQACKCFVGNLAYTIDDDTVREFFKDCGEITDIHWLTDKETGQFYGSGFIEFGKGGAQEALKKAGQDLMGRPLKIDMAKPKAPRAGGAAGGFQKREPKPISEKPEGCNTLFMGNLSYDIDDAAVTDFFKEHGEIANIRWLTDRETGDFKGCGFVEFANPDSVDGAIKLNGEDLMGRGVRLDYSAPKKKW
eukprot:COSAG05_NODE_347_length_10963_cov_157.340943_9_plen_302_part_00